MAPKNQTISPLRPLFQVMLHFRVVKAVGNIRSNLETLWMWKDRSLCGGEPMHSLQPIFWGIKVAPGQMSNKWCHQGQAKPVLAQGKGINLDSVLNIDSRNA